MDKPFIVIQIFFWSLGHIFFWLSITYKDRIKLNSSQFNDEVIIDELIERDSDRVC